MSTAEEILREMEHNFDIRYWAERLAGAEARPTQQDFDIEHTKRLEIEQRALKAEAERDELRKRPSFEHIQAIRHALGRAEYQDVKPANAWEATLHLCKAYSKRRRPAADLPSSLRERVIEYINDNDPYFWDSANERKCGECGGRPGDHKVTCEYVLLLRNLRAGSEDETRLSPELRQMLDDADRSAPLTDGERIERLERALFMLASGYYSHLENAHKRMVTPMEEFESPLGSIARELDREREEGGNE